MFYVKQVPWHGLGVQVENELTAAEAIKAAGLDWEVQLKQLQMANGTLVDAAAVVRPENQVLGIVGPRYTPIQNHEAFDFFDSVVGAGKAIYHTAGALSGGERIWLLAKLPEDMIIGGKDEVKKYLLLANSHNGTSTLRMLWTPIRCVCQNTLNIALRGAGKADGISIRHTKNAKTKIEEAQRALGFAIDYYSNFEIQANEMTKKYFGDNQMKELVEKLLPANEDGKISKQAESKRDDILKLWKSGGTGNEIWQGTSWGAFNTITEWADHCRGSDNPESHLNSVWFGGAMQIKQKAFETIQRISA
jgi:phage/plasmid-like protein (TIGR03299 family)